MDPSDAQMSRLVSATANRLRLIQIDFADQSPDERREYMEEAIERATGSLVPGQRQAFLAQLQEMFPTWDRQVAVRRETEEAATAAPTDARELQDPGFLTTRLLELAPTLNELQREAIIKRMTEAGLTSTGRPNWSAEAVRELRKALDLGEDAEPEPTRVMQELTLLAMCIMSLDQLVWRTWKMLAPHSSLRRPQKLQHLMAKLVSGDANISRGEVKEALDRLRHLIAGLISAIGQVGQQFATRHMSRMAPQEIESLVRMEPGGVFQSIEVKCWRKYQELAKSMDEASIEKEIRSAVADYAESLMKGFRR